MDSVVLLSVLLLAITNIVVLARPTDIHLKTKRSTDESSIKTFNPRQIKFPTDMAVGFQIKISGQIDISDAKTFETTIKTGSDKEEDTCKIVFHLEDRIVEISPAEIANNQIDLNEDLKEEIKGHPYFSINVTINDTGFIIQPEYNGVDTPFPITCPKQNYKDFAYIEFSENLHSLHNLTFIFA